MVAIEVTHSRKTRPKAAALVSQVNIVTTGKSGPSSEPAPTIAKMTMRVSASADWVSEPATGAWLWRPEAARKRGRTRDRPREKK